jgi:hypothetical protein
MAEAKIKYAASTALTITLASLASSATAGRESTAVDNQTNLYDDVIVGGQITVNGTTAVTANTQIEVWVYASWDGTNFAGGGTGVDAAFSPVQQAKTYMRLGAILPVTATTVAIAHKFILPSLVTLFGAMPRKWGIFVIQNTGQVLHVTAGNHFINYTGITYTSA